MIKTILYISVHSTLEYDELSLLTEQGYDCFSLGAYTDPKGHYLLPRPGIPGMNYYPELAKLASEHPRTELPKELIDFFDAVIIMDGYHSQAVIEGNWEKIKHKKVIWRTIGQSLPHVEKKMQRFRREGMKIVRYSPLEAELDNYIGHDAIIRFYKDPNEFKDWTGHSERVINFTQTLRGRRLFCGHDFIMGVGPGFPFKVYGTGNEDLGEYNGGEIPYELLKGQLRDSRVYLYGGTWPAPYTLGFIEAWMTGIPIVSLGPETWMHKDHKDVKIFEIKKLISRGDNGYWTDNVEEAKEMIRKLLSDYSYAQTMGAKGREDAIRIFGKDKIKEEWRVFLEGL